ncbi:MAG: AraC family transcriptional regulator, partial [Bacteroidota bacterium]
YFQIFTTTLLVMQVYREITPVTTEDFFYIVDHEAPDFGYPIHLHPEYELNLVLNCEGERIIGDSIQPFGTPDLVLIGPNVYHSWESESTQESLRKAGAKVITIQFREDLFGHTMLQTKSMYPIRQMLEQSKRGLSFTGKTREQAIPMLESLCRQSPGFGASLAFLELLNFLAISEEKESLISEGFNHRTVHIQSKRIDKVHSFLKENFTRAISLKEVADLANMSESAFSHFFKRSTNKSFTQFLIDLRLGHAARLLLDTQENISQICYACGFNNVSNFNRLFKKHKGTTPQEYRKLFYTAPKRKPEEFVARSA